MPTEAQVREAREILKPPSMKDLDGVRARRYQVKDILNTDLLGPEARKSYQELYDQTGRILTDAVVGK